ncbi:DUF2786 domain-containing protein [Methylocystis sp.]|uniref:DUF2786 domain-containing protein n=1 Tax=Methylocystis sp. TaxID=1911079 RepID=UPI0025ED5A9E|nr:DUF2786 domain-containing protein [Methylocystis sp.]
MARSLRMQETITELLLEAMTFCVDSKVEETVRKWLTHADIAPDDPHAGECAAGAMIFALELSIFAPSMSGVRPIDRMARQFKAKTFDDAAALEALKKARFTLFRILSVTQSHVFKAEDLATGETFLLLEQSFSPSALGRDIAARICRLDYGLHVATSPKIPLDEACLAVAKEFIRPGKGLVNDQRCAAAVYRHVVRHGVDDAVEFGVLPEPEEVFALSHPDDELDALARDWAERAEGAEPSRDDLEVARALTSGRRLAAALVSTVELRRMGQSRHADVYRRLALIQMETLHRRAFVGSGEINPLGTLHSTLEELAAKRRYPHEALGLFRELSRRISVDTGGTKHRDEDLGRVIERIRGLRAKTIEQGCTEQEALAAADKVGELLERYGLSLSEVELRQQPCEGFSIDTGRRKHGAFDRCVPAIADFCDCRVWSENSPRGTLRFVFFGLSVDVEAAHYLYDLVAIAFETETATFKSGTIYAMMVGGEKRSAVNSFQIGLARGVSAKLETLKAQRNVAVFNSTGRDLVPIKTSVIDEEFEKLGLSLHAKNVSSRRRVLADAYEAGHEAGRKFEVRAGIE